MIIIPQRTIDNGSVIYLRGDSGNYMSRMGATGLELSKEVADQYCRLTVTLIQIGTVKKLALQGDTGKFMSRMGATGLELSKDSIDQYSQFSYSIDPASGQISLQGDTGLYMSRMGAMGLELTKERIDRYSQFLVVSQG
ncbi:hypothetical protein [Pseudomonas purpurea]|uniref:fascin domain-containing protein n=1 Tax=Pseudomonas purpurea TaxID=3136737 RepID=UPI003264F0D3